MSTDPNADASPESVADQIAGTDNTGTPLKYEEVAAFYSAGMFGLSETYAFPQGAYVSSAEPDHVTGLAKLFTRLTPEVDVPAGSVPYPAMPDGNVYDALDALWTILKATLLANPTINNDEPLSVNYIAPTGTSAELVEHLGLLRQNIRNQRIQANVKFLESQK